jgi:hypothetical protein
MARRTKAKVETVETEVTEEVTPVKQEVQQNKKPKMTIEYRADGAKVMCISGMKIVSY